MEDKITIEIFLKSPYILLPLLNCVLLSRKPARRKTKKLRRKRKMAAEKSEHKQQANKFKM